MVTQVAGGHAPAVSRRAPIRHRSVTVGCNNARTVRLHVDRDLPVPVTAQLLGQIEYGVTNGDVPPGSRLPSVRALAADLGVSPVTVSQVFKALKAKGLIATVPGRGTFVRGEGDAATPPSPTAHVDAALGRALRVGERAGLPRRDLLQRFQRLIAQNTVPPALRLVFVGVYPGVTRAYVADLARHLRPGDRLEPTTFAQLDEPSVARALTEADVVLTFAHRAEELARRLPAGVEVASVQLIPAQRTRVALAEIDPLERVLLVSAVPEFVATFRRGIDRFASHVADVRVAVVGAPELPDLVADADVVVLASGAEDVFDGLPFHVRAFEYRHVPDPVHVERVLVPRFERVRAARAASHPMEETP